MNILWRRAEEVGFTKSGLRQMLAIVNLNPRTMRLDQLRDLWPYVNAINAKKFG